jgi:hypothetical protein
MGTRPPPFHGPMTDSGQSSISHRFRRFRNADIRPFVSLTNQLFRQILLERFNVG